MTETVYVPVYNGRALNFFFKTKSGIEKWIDDFVSGKSCTTERPMIMEFVHMGDNDES